MHGLLRNILFDMTRGLYLGFNSVHKSIVMNVWIIVHHCTRFRLSIYPTYIYLALK